MTIAIANQYIYFPHPSTNDPATWRAAIRIGPSTLFVFGDHPDTCYTVGPPTAAAGAPTYPALVPTFGAVPGPGVAIPAPALNEHIFVGGAESDFPWDPIPVASGERINIAGLGLLDRTDGWSLDGSGSVLSATEPGYGKYKIDVQVSFRSSNTDDLVTWSMWIGRNLATIGNGRTVSRYPAKSTNSTDPAGAAPHGFALVGLPSMAGDENELVLRVEHNSPVSSDITVEYIFVSVERVGALPEV